MIMTKEVHSSLKKGGDREWVNYGILTMKYHTEVKMDQSENRMCQTGENPE